MQDGRRPQERISNIRAIYGNKHAKPATTGMTMVQNMKETGSQPLSLHDDAEVPESSKEFLLHVL